MVVNRELVVKLGQKKFTADKGRNGKASTLRILDKRLARQQVRQNSSKERAIYLPDLLEFAGNRNPLPLPPFQPISTISLFTGAGGMDLGFESAGFSTQCCVEIDEFSCLTLQLNKEFGIRTGIHSFLEQAFIICSDVKAVNSSKLLNLANVKKGKLGLLHGGPPCQAFSVFGKRKGLEDTRGMLLWDYAELVEALEPKCFVLENVEGLRTYDQSSVLNQLCERLSLDGKYKISVHIYNVADFGIPQFRKRIFIIGSREGRSVPEMTPTHEADQLTESSLKPYRTVHEALRGIGEPNITPFPNHSGRVHSEEIVERYKALAFGERDHKTRINKLHPERPSYTIIVGSDKGGGKGHVHPYSPREVTPRESARMQTFPDFWGFSGTSRHPIRQIGNAVPPLFAALLGAHIRKHLFDETTSLAYEDAISYLGLDYLLS